MKVKTVALIILTAHYLDISRYPICYKTRNKHVIIYIHGIYLGIDMT